MIKVTHILHLEEFENQNPFSGAENHVLTLLPGLKEAGADVELVVFLWRNGPIIADRLSTLKDLGICITLIEPSPGSSSANRSITNYKVWFDFFRIMRSRRNRLIHVHLDLRNVIFCAWLAGCKKIVLTIHNDEPNYTWLIWRIWLRIMDRAVTQYIGITNHVSQYFIGNSGIAEKKITTIYYGVQPPEVSISTVDSWNIAPGTFVVGFIGRLTRQKNLKLFIETLEKFPQFTGVIIGDGELREDLENQVKSRNQKNIIFCGAIPNAASLIKRFDLFCLPSSWEGLGLVLIEAMLQKVPIVASQAGAMPEVLGEGKYGLLFDLSKTSSLAEKFEYSASHQKENREMAQQAYEYARKTFSINKMNLSTMALYQNL